MKRISWKLLLLLPALVLWAFEAIMALGTKPGKPEVKSTYADPVYEYDGMWFFWNETWADSEGPYPTETKAREALERYCKILRGTHVS